MEDGHQVLGVAFFAVMRSPALFSTLGTDTAWSRVQACFDIIRKESERNGGTFIKTITMNKALVTFGDAGFAITAAVDILAEVGGRQAEIPIAAAVSYGDVLWEQGDVFGHTVHIAARILEQTKQSQILASADAVNALPPGFDPPARHIDQMPAKGIQTPIDLFEVLWETEDVTHMGSSIRPDASRRLQLSHGGQTIMLDGASGGLVLGRGADVGLQVNEPRASRIHLRIAPQRDKFIITDESANGTWIEMSGSVQRLARKERLTLIGSGRIALGGDFDRVTNVVEFVCLDD